MPGGRSSGSATTSCCRSPPRWPMWMRRSLPGSTAGSWSRSSRRSPMPWLPDDPVAGDAAAQRRLYVAYLERRLAAPRPFVDDAERARAAA